MTRSSVSENNYGHGSGDCGSVAFSACRGLYLGGAPIHGLSSRGGGTALTLRRNGGRGCSGVRQKCRMRGGSGALEGPRHASDAYAGECVFVQHDQGTLLSTRGVS